MERSFILGRFLGVAKALDQKKIRLPLAMVRISKGFAPGEDNDCFLLVSKGFALGGDNYDCTLLE